MSCTEITVISNNRELANPSAVIIDRALDPITPSSLCAATIDLFVSILAGEAGNLALKTTATGGIYLAGGVTVDTCD